MALAPYKFVLRSRPNIPAGDDDRANIIRRFTLDRSTLSDHGDVHDFRRSGAIDGLFSYVSSKNGAL